MQRSSKIPDQPLIAIFSFGIKAQVFTVLVHGRV
jgi:hypothetical protein